MLSVVVSFFLFDTNISHFYLFSKNDDQHFSLVIQMNCLEFERRIYSEKILNQAMSDDSGSWWWWINIIGNSKRERETHVEEEENLVKNLSKPNEISFYFDESRDYFFFFFKGTLCFGTIGLIGNVICCLLVYRSTLSEHSFVEYLRSLSIFDILSLLFELIQSLNDLFRYKYQLNLLNFSSRLICKCYEYMKHVVILLSCWTIVGLTFDRLILVCEPLSKKYPSISRRICNRPCAKKILWMLIFISLVINIPHILYQEWVCRYSGYQHSAAFSFSSPTDFNRTLNKSFQICQCRISTNLSKPQLMFFIQWNNYVYHLFSYTLIPAIILITSNIGKFIFLKLFSSFDFEFVF